MDFEPRSPIQGTRMCFKAMDTTLENPEQNQCAFNSEFHQPDNFSNLTYAAPEAKEVGSETITTKTTTQGAITTDSLSQKKTDGKIDLLPSQYVPDYLPTNEATNGNQEKKPNQDEKVQKPKTNGEGNQPPPDLDPNTASNKKENNPEDSDI